MPQPSFEMEESRSVIPWVNRLYFESPRALSFLRLRLVKARHKNLVPLFFGVKSDPMVGLGRYAESIPVKCPISADQAQSSSPQKATIKCTISLHNQPGGCCNQEYPSENHLMTEISIVCNLFVRDPIILKCFTKHDSDTAVLCAKLQNYLATAMDIMDIWVLNWIGFV